MSATPSSRTLTLLVTSPRVPAGVLSRDAWRALESATVLAADAGDPVPEAVAASGISVTTTSYADPSAAARALIAATAEGDVVWIGSPDADPGLTDALAVELTASDDPPAVEVLVGSWDLPGARLLDAVAVVDALRSPDGCPWDAQQTHATLTKYLLEEAHEAVEAMESGDQTHIAEELGDVLFQVLFNARIAEEADAEPFDIDTVAGALVTKLIRRHPHVFADGEASTPAEVEAAWEQIKAAEKSGQRDSSDLLAGIPASLSTLLIADKVQARLERAGTAQVATPPSDIGSRLWDLVAEARAQGTSADALLRAHLRGVTRSAG